MNGMKSIDELFPSMHLAAADLQGVAVDVTIMDVREQMEVGTKKELKPALLFAESPRNADGSAKWFIANKTNCRAIAKMYGVYPRAWIGKRITIYPTEVEFAGEMRTAIRAKTTPPAQPLPQGSFTQTAPAAVPIGGGVG